MAKPKNKGKKTRLEDLVVHEVSIVDRPANGRPFSIVKADDMSTETVPVSQTENGDLVTKTEGADNTPPVPAEQGGNPGIPSDGEQLSKGVISEIFGVAHAAFGDERIAKGLDISPDVRSVAFSEMRRIMRRIDTAMSVASMAGSTPDGLAVSEFQKMIGDELRAIAGVVNKIAGQFGAGKSRTRKSEADVEYAKALEAIEGVLGEQIEKAGARMAKSRLDSFKKALGTLIKLYTESGGSPLGEDVSKSLGERDEQIAELREKLTKANAEIKRLRNARPSSAVIPVEKGEPGGSKVGDVWPSDFNQTSPTVNF